MKKFSAIAILFLGAYLSNSAAASTSSCYEYYVGDAPYLAHKSTYSASEAALDVTFGMTTTQSSPFSNTIYSYFGANSSGGTETVAGVVPYAATWRWGGVSAIGHQAGAIFYYTESTYSNVCNGSESYSVPTGAYVEINPNVVDEGETVYFSWGAFGEVSQCALNSVPLSPTIGVNVAVVAAIVDTGTYTVYCSNYFGQGSPGSDSLVVNDVITCGQISVDSAAISEVNSWPAPAAYEQGAILVYTQDDTLSANYPETSFTSWNSTPSNDPCELSLAWPTGTLVSGGGFTDIHISIIQLNIMLAGDAMEIKAQLHPHSWLS